MSFAEHASIQAIEWQLTELRKGLSQTQRKIKKMEELATLRRAQMAAGEWPPQRGDAS